MASGAKSRGFINATFNNAGTTTSSIGGSLLALNDSAIFNNSGTFRFLGNGDNISVTSGTGTFNNTGTLEVSGAITNAVNNVAFTNAGGTLSSGASGTLNLPAGGSHSGNITITGTGVRFNGGTHSFADSTTIAGQLNVAGATASFGTVTTNGLVNYSSGAINVTSGDTLTLNGGMNWTGSVNISGPGTVSLPSGQTLGCMSASTVSASPFACVAMPEAEPPPVSEPLHADEPVHANEPLHADEPSPMPYDAQLVPPGGRPPHRSPRVKSDASLVPPGGGPRK